MSAPDPSRSIAALAKAQAALELKTVDLCFVSALYLRADRTAVASFDEDALIDMFEQVCDVVEPGAENPRKRATHAIQRLREQHMLARVDGAGIVRAGEYALTRLAAAVVEYFLADEELTRESLTLLTATLRAQLAAVLAEARRANADTEAWRQKIVGPLRVTVGDLIAGIERRQRGLDAQQEEVQGEISALLQAAWFDAIDRCQSLLEATTATLRELNDILLVETSHFHALLQDLQTLALGAGQAEAEEAILRVSDHVDRIANWGRARQTQWSAYYQHVLRYLRDVVRLDPERALSHRLREQVVGWASRPFHLQIAHAPSIRLLRPLEARVERPTVARPREDREAAPEWVDAEDALAQIDALVREALAGGAATLAEVTARVLPALPDHAGFVAAGRIAECLAGVSLVRAERERPWRPVRGRLEIEDWSMPRAREGEP